MKFSLQPITLRRELITLSGIFALGLIARFALFKIQGVMPAGDTDYFVASAKAIMDEGLSFYLKNVGTAYYWGYPTFLALIFGIFGESGVAVVIFQIILSSLSIVALYQTAWDVFEDRIIPLFTALAYALFVECFRWDLYVLSDSLGLSLLILSVFLFMRQSKHHGWKRSALVILCIISCFLLFTVRTNSFVAVIIIILALMGQIRKRNLKIAVYLGLSLGAAASVIMMLHSTAGFGLPARLNYYLDYFRSGKIIYGMPEYNYPVDPTHFGTPLFALDVLAMVLIKIVYFWSVFPHNYSLFHKLMNIILFVPIYAFGLLGLFFIFREKVTKASIPIILIFAYNILQAFSEIDFDWRYRIPVFPFLIMIAVYGCCKSVMSIRKLRTPSVPHGS